MDLYKATFKRSARSKHEREGSTKRERVSEHGTVSSSKKRREEGVSVC